MSVQINAGCCSVSSKGLSWSQSPAKSRFLLHAIAVWGVIFFHSIMLFSMPVPVFAAERRGNAAVCMRIDKQNS